MQGLESLNQFKNFVSSLGGLGRFEDTYMVHAAEGETVVPMEVLDRNPVLKKRLFKSMKALGIDPGRYIVGNDLNSLNPVTGQPEFFFKKVFKRLKKAAGDISGYAAPIVGAMYGPAAGALVGAGLGAFKRENPGDPSQWAQMGMLGGGSGIAANLLGGKSGMDLFTGKGLSSGLKAGASRGPWDIFKHYTEKGEGMDRFKEYSKLFDKTSGGASDTAQKALDVIEKKAISGEPITAEESRTRDILKDIIKKDKQGLFGNMSLSQIATMYGLGTAGLGFLLDRAESDEDVGTRVKPYVPHGLDYGWEKPTIVYDYDRPIVPAMGHGGVMDLQGGGHARGPGTGTSDSIPAMLSDGEFVMTADAVRGAGGGDRREGAKRMYEAMDRLEARV